MNIGPFTLEGSTTLTESQIETCLNKLPPNVISVLKQGGPRIVLAGGLIRDTLEGESINDIDLFVKSEAEARAYATALGGTLSTITKTERALTVIADKKFFPVQLVYAWGNESAAQVIKQFDFSCCQAAIWYDEGWKSLTALEFDKHRKCRVLVYTSPRGNNPFGSLMRAFRLVSRGYGIDSEQVAKIVGECATQFDPDADPGETLAFMKARLPKTRIY